MGGIELMVTSVAILLVDQDGIAVFKPMGWRWVSWMLARTRSLLALCAAFHHGICKSAFILALTCSMTSSLTVDFFLARRIFQSRDFT